MAFDDRAITGAARPAGGSENQIDLSPHPASGPVTDLLPTHRGAHGDPVRQAEHAGLDVIRARRNDLAFGGHALLDDLVHELVVFATRIEPTLHARRREVIVVGEDLSRRKREDERVAVAVEVWAALVVAGLPVPAPLPDERELPDLAPPVPPQVPVLT